MIRSMNLKIPVVYAGNVENQEEMRLIFPEEEGEQLYIVENVYPKIDALNVEPAGRSFRMRLNKTSPMLQAWSTSGRW